MMKRVMIIAGEASGDVHGANLVRAYQQIDPELRFFGVGGEQMRAAGVDVVFDSSEVAVVGLFEVFKHLPQIREVLNWAKEAVHVGKPDAVLLIDFPDFNFRVAKAAKRAGVPVLYYISPQVWAWRRRRVKFLARNVSKMAVIFPFEVPFYTEAGVDAEFVGHPLLDAPRVLSRDDARQQLDLGDGKIVALLPGSRTSELDHHLPTLARAAAKLSQTHDDLRFVIPVASTLRAAEVEAVWKRSLNGVVPNLQLHDGESSVVLAAADAAAVCSGTATLEAALAGAPSVVIYRLNPMTYMLGRLLVRVSHVGLVNLVAGRTVAPELIQNDFTPDAVAAEVGRLLDDPQAREDAQRGLADVRERLGGPGASKRAAQLLHELLEEQQHDRASV